MEKLDRVGQIQFRMDSELRILMEKYIIDNELERAGILLHNLIKKIVLEWLDNPILDENLIFWQSKVWSRDRGSIRGNLTISDDDWIRLNRIYVIHYIRKISTINTLVYNIIDQWSYNNIPEYRKVRRIEEN